MKVMNVMGEQQKAKVQTVLRRGDLFGGLVSLFSFS